MELTSEQEYWNAHVKCLRALRSIGVELKLRDRIHPMKVIAIVERIKRNNGPKAVCKALEESVNVIVTLRRLGCEPPHTKDLYE